MAFQVSIRLSIAIVSAFWTLAAVSSKLPHDVDLPVGTSLRYNDGAKSIGDPAVYSMDDVDDEEDEEDQYYHNNEKRAIFSIRLDGKSSECYFSGYKPNGPITNINAIKSPKATLGMKSGLAKILSGAKKMGQGAAIAMHAMKFSATLMKKAPMLGPALGVFSAVTGLINPAPTPQDILNAVNDAVGKLTSEVNRKIDQMRGYVDSKIAELEKNLISKEYTTSFNLWARCILEPTEELVTECQRDSVKLLIPKKTKFTPLANELTSKRKISFSDVRTLEAYMLAFRDYANLVLMELTPLVEYYCIKAKNKPNAAHYCNVYTNDMKNEAQSFIQFAKNAIAAIKKGHWGTKNSGSCSTTVRCDKQSKIKEGMWNKHTANGAKCRCEIESSNTKKYCEIRFTIRADGKTPYVNFKYNYHKNDLAGGGKEYAGRVLLGLAQEYQRKNHQIMDKYWQLEILNFIPNWTEAIEIANMMKAKNPVRSGDAPNMDFSSNFQERIAASGHPTEFDTL